MADSSTVRAQRARLHKRGDHSMCRPDRCPKANPARPKPFVEPIVTAVEEPSEPERLGPRGSRLWVDMTSSWGPSPLHREMLLEACRMADRLEQLDRQLKGEDWLRFWKRDDLGTEVTVHVDKALIEARELQNAFRMAVSELMKAVPATEPVKKGGGVLADLAARRAARGAHTAG